MLATPLIFQDKPLPLSLPQDLSPSQFSIRFLSPGWLRLPWPALGSPTPATLLVELL